MACTPREQVPLLDCCGIAVDYVVRGGGFIDTALPIGEINHEVLDTIYDQMLADEFIIGGKVNGNPHSGTIEWFCDNFRFGWAPDPFHRPITVAFHGYFKRINSRLAIYLAAKARWRLPSMRRWCISGCLHVPSSGNCPEFNCDSSGQLTTTLFPAASQMEVIPDRIAVLAERPFVAFRHDYTWKTSQYDSDPPASPFCGLP